MSRSIRLGCLLNAEYPVAELVRLGQVAESLGYAQLWYTDLRLFRECFVGLTALAMSTHRIALGPGVTDPYSRHPAVTASTMATFDELAGGRALLGLGVGGTGFRELGISTKLPVAALRETVDVVRRLLAGERVTVEGKVVTLHEGRLQFTPVRKSMPIYFATHGAQVMRLAGEVADGVLVANTLVPSVLEFYLEQLRAGRAKTGRTLDDLDVSLRPEICLDADEDAAMVVMRRRVRRPPDRGVSSLGVPRAPGRAPAGHVHRDRRSEGDEPARRGRRQSAGRASSTGRCWPAAPNELPISWRPSCGRRSGRSRSGLMRCRARM